MKPVEHHPTETSLNAPHSSLIDHQHPLPSHDWCPISAFPPPLSAAMDARPGNPRWFGVGAWGGSHGVLHSGILLVVGYCQMFLCTDYSADYILLQQAPSYGWGSKQCTLWECLPSGRLMITCDHTWIFIFKTSPEIDPLKHGSRITFWSKYTQTYW